MSYDFRQKQNGRFVVDVYKVGATDLIVSRYYYDNVTLARKFCATCFKKDEVYKVKLWDLTRGKIIPNRPDAPGLILELV